MGKALCIKMFSPSPLSPCFCLQTNKQINKQNNNKNPKIKQSDTLWELERDKFQISKSLDQNFSGINVNHIAGSGDSNTVVANAYYCSNDVK